MSGTPPLTPTQAKKAQRKRQRERIIKRDREQRAALAKALKALTMLDRSMAGLPETVVTEAMTEARGDAHEAVEAILPLVKS